MLRATARRLMHAAGLRRIGPSDASENFGTLSFSQEGEDMILARIFEGKERGFYVDVGAHHPKRFSNTYHFYLRGWRGINIDAAPGSKALFDAVRPSDINLEVAIADSRRVLTYYAFNEPALNSFAPDLAMERSGLRDYRIVSKQQFETRTLTEVLDENLPPDTEIDFMSVDVEGFDYEVLKSNDWTRFRPQIVLVEELDVTLQQLDESSCVALLRGVGYRPTCKTYYNLVFSRTD